MSIRVERKFNKEQKVSALHKAVMFSVTLGKSVQDYYSRCLHIHENEHVPVLFTALYNKLRIFK